MNPIDLLRWLKLCRCARIYWIVVCHIGSVLRNIAIDRRFKTPVVLKLGKVDGHSRGDLA